MRVAVYVAVCRRLLPWMVLVCTYVYLPPIMSTCAWKDLQTIWIWMCTNTWVSGFTDAQIYPQFHACIYIYMIYVYICMYMYTHIHIHIYVYISFTYVYIYIFIYIRVCMYTCICIYICVYIFIYLCIYVQTYMWHIRVASQYIDKSHQTQRIHERHDIFDWIRK